MAGVAQPLLMGDLFVLATNLGEPIKRAVWPEGRESWRFGGIIQRAGQAASDFPGEDVGSFQGDRGTVKEQPGRRVGSLEIRGDYPTTGQAVSFPSEPLAARHSGQGDQAGRFYSGKLSALPVASTAALD